MRHAESAVLGRGPNVFLRPPRRADEDDYLAVVRASRRLHRPWSAPPGERQKFLAYVKRNEADDYEGMLVCACEDGRIVGSANFGSIVRGPLQQAFLGYWVAAGHEGRGVMTEAVALALGHAFGALKLHRVEANIQPGNEASVRLARRLGFRREGFSPRYLKILGKWRDHERWAITREDWRARKRPG